MTTTPSLAPEEAIVRQLVSPGADVVGWVQAPAELILGTYFPRGQRYLGGQLVAPTDQILMVKMHGHFVHPAPLGGKATASLVLAIHITTSGETIPFSQMWDGDAPDLGIGFDPGITDRDLAAKRWDLRLLGTPNVLAA